MVPAGGFAALLLADELHDALARRSQRASRPHGRGLHAQTFQYLSPDAPLPSFGFQVLKTPGHTPGGRCYYFPEEGFVLTGDTLFAGSVGRTDFPGGSETDLRKSILDILFTLPPKTVAYPGHGPRTTIAIEKMDPFFS